MKKRLRNMPKRLLCVFMAILTIMSSFTCLMATNVYAATTGTYSDWYGHHRFQVNGKDAFCIHYGANSSGQFETNQASLDYWNNDLSSKSRENIRRVLDVAEYLGYMNSSDDATYFAVQRAVWKQINKDAEKGISPFFVNSTDEKYNKIIDTLKNYDSIFAAPNKDLVLEPKNGKYVASHTASLYKKWSIDTSKTNSKISASISGSKLTVESKDGYFGGKRKVYFKSDYNVYTML